MLLKTGSKALMSSSRRAKWTNRPCSRRTQGTRAVCLLYLLCSRSLLALLQNFYVLYSSSLLGFTCCTREQFTCFTCFTRAVYLLSMLYSSSLLALHALLEQCTCLSGLPSVAVCSVLVRTVYLLLTNLLY